MKTILRQLLNQDFRTLLSDRTSLFIVNGYAKM